MAIRPSTRLLRWLAVFGLGLAATACRSTETQPRLVVLISVDQMRADYVERFQHQWTRGLRRLVDRGARFNEAVYPYMNTVTCAGHATMATGSVPAEHGQVKNEWWDRAGQRIVTCTTDETARPVSYGAPTPEAHSGARLKVRTLAEEMHAQLVPAPRVVTLSLKARSAIMLAGRHGDAVTWFDNKRGAWVTSTAFSPSPVPHLARFLASRAVKSDLGKIWSRLLPANRYLYDDVNIGRQPSKPWGPTLPHELVGIDRRVDPAFYEQWESSPFSDEFLTEMAIASVDGLGLGARGRTDFLGVSFSALDKVGHDFGPFSHEVQDVLARLDQSIGRLLDGLDERVGRDRYVVGLTADHGVSPVPDQMKALGTDAGRIDSHSLADAIERTMTTSFGPGTYVSVVEHTDVYFAPGVYARLVRDPETLGAVLKVIGEWPGVWRVYRGDLLPSRAPDDPVASAIALSYVSDRSGDLVLVPKPYWVTSGDSAATHGTLHPYDARVPLILMGAPFKPGTYLEPSSPTDLAPTLAHTVGVTMTRPRGRILREALQTATP